MKRFPLCSLQAFVWSTVLMGVGLVAEAQQPEAVPPPAPLPPTTRWAETAGHPSALRVEAQYAPQPYWAARVAEDQAERRERARFQPYHPLRPHAGSVAMWNLAPYGRPYYHLTPVLVYPRW